MINFISIFLCMLFLCTACLCFSIGINADKKWDVNGFFIGGFISTIFLIEILSMSIITKVNL